MKKIRRSIDPLIILFSSKTAINTYAVFLGNGISAFFAFIFTVTAFRMMSLEDFGYFSAFLSFILLVSDISELGLGTSLSKFLPPLESEKTKLLSFLKSAFYLQCLIALAVFLVLIIIAPILTNQLFHSDKYIWLIQVSAVSVFIALFAQFFQYALSARQKFFQIGFISAVSSIFRVIFLIILILFSAVNLTTVAWLHVLTFFLTALTAVLFLKLEFLKVKRTAGDIAKLIKFASFLGIARGFTALASRLDVLMLVSLAGPAQAGIYSTASRVIAIYPLLAGSFSGVIAPKLSSSTDKIQAKKFIYKIIFGTVAIIGTVLFLILIAEPFMIILFTEKAREAVVVFQYLLISMIFFVASIPAVSLATYYLHKPQILTLNSVIQLVIVITGNLIFIPLFGKLGPAISLILAYGITLFTTSLFSLIYLRRSWR